MRKVFSLASIYIYPAYINHIKVIIAGHLGIELDIHGGVFLEVTIEMLGLGNMTLAQDGTESRENDGSIHNINTTYGCVPLHIENTLTVLIFLGIIIEISNFYLRLIIGRRSSFLLRRFKTKSIPEFIHHVIDVSLV